VVAAGMFEHAVCVVIHFDVSERFRIVRHRVTKPAKPTAATGQNRARAQ
jgi:hypothetical protein